MTLFQLSHRKYSGNLTGEGGHRVAGRWHYKGTPCLYTCASRSRCIVEIGYAVAELPNAMAFTIYEVPDESLQVFDIGDLPVGWQNWPPESSRAFGDQNLQKTGSLLLSYPSAVFPDERIYIINPRHPMMKLVKVVGIEDFTAEDAGDI